MVMKASPRHICIEVEYTILEVVTPTTNKAQFKIITIFSVELRMGPHMKSSFSHGSMSLAQMGYLKCMAQVPTEDEGCTGDQYTQLGLCDRGAASELWVL